MPAHSTCSCASTLRQSATSLPSTCAQEGSIYAEDWPSPSCQKSVEWISCMSGNSGRLSWQVLCNACQYWCAWKCNWAWKVHFMLPGGFLSTEQADDLEYGIMLRAINWGLARRKAITDCLALAVCWLQILQHCFQENKKYNFHLSCGLLLAKVHLPLQTISSLASNVLPENTGMKLSCTRCLLRLSCMRCLLELPRESALLFANCLSPLENAISLYWTYSDIACIVHYVHIVPGFDKYDLVQRILSIAADWVLDCPEDWLCWDFW